jgi:hypothetical protein
LLNCFGFFAVAPESFFIVDSELDSDSSRREGDESFKAPGHATLLADVAPSLEAINLLREMQSWDDYPKYRLTASRVFRRRDLSGTYRGVDRDLDVDFATLKALTALNRFQPALLFFDSAPHQPIPFVFSEVARWLGLKVVFFQPCPLAPAMIARRRHDDEILPESLSVASSPYREEIIGELDAAISRIMSGSRPTYIQRQNNSDLSSRLARSPFSRLRSLWVDFQKPEDPYTVEFSSHDGLAKWARRLLSILFAKDLRETLEKRLARFSSGLPSSPFCLFAMHYEPERTVFPEGLPLLSQVDAIFTAVSIVDGHASLAIKEHSSQLSRAMRGWVGRSPMFYHQIVGVPKVFLLPAEPPASELVAGAEFVFTMTGTIAIEAALLGRPVAYFGSPWWEGLPGTIKVEPGTTFEEIMSLPTSNETQIREFLKQRVLHSMVPGIGFHEPDSFRRKFVPVSSSVVNSQIDTLRQVIRSELERPQAFQANFSNQKAERARESSDQIWGHEPSIES